MVQVMACHYLILYSFVIEIEGMLWAVTLEYIEILHCELIILIPPDSKPLLRSTPNLALLQHASIQQIVHFLIIYLQETACDVYMLFLPHTLSLGKYLPYTP